MGTEITIAVASEARTSWKEAGGDLLGEWKCSRNVPYLDSPCVFMRVYVCQNSSNCFRPVPFTGCHLYLKKKKKKSKLKDGSGGSPISKKTVTNSFLGVKRTTVTLIYGKKGSLRGP